MIIYKSKIVIYSNLKGVFMKRKVLLSILVLFISCSFAYAETEMQKTNRLMNECIQNNLCYKANAQLQVVYVNEYAWRVSNFDDKQNISAFFLAYTRARNPQAVFVDIRSSSSGKTIGSYNKAWGYKEK